MRGFVVDCLKNGGQWRKPRQVILYCVYLYCLAQQGTIQFLQRVSIACYAKRGSVTFGRRRLGAADWAPPFGRPPFGRRKIMGAGTNGRRRLGAADWALPPP